MPIDPPYRLDPFQNIINIHWESPTSTDSTALPPIVLVAVLTVSISFPDQAWFGHANARWDSLTIGTPVWLPSTESRGSAVDHGILTGSMDFGDPVFQYGSSINYVGASGAVNWGITSSAGAYGWSLDLSGFIFTNDFGDVYRLDHVTIDPDVIQGGFGTNVAYNKVNCYFSQ